ncbi:hypothetical protein [Streptomyces sp. B15]|uniref:hypothetical protein n=1 Tax=Streptomyces sp. B15 TaxID=1537797 RepID=UPI001B37B915|nr:hypothetical protein [Streptomyces sp. B15]MBQ1119661.1 hypothetical protein [Streptomyces sp. B15]
MPSRRLPGFEVEIKRARDLVGIGQSISSITHGLVAGEDHFRSGLVHSVAALDSYVHGVILDRAVDILMGRLTVNTGSKVGLGFGAIGEVMSARQSDVATAEMMARTFVSERLGLETYQRPDDIGAALSMVGVSRIWSSAFQADAYNKKTALGVIVTRRNRIVHQCDLDPLSGSPTVITAADAVGAIGTIEEIVRKIDPHC